jgi:hypothetical protein
MLKKFIVTIDNIMSALELKEDKNSVYDRYRHMMYQ